MSKETLLPTISSRSPVISSQKLRKAYVLEGVDWFGEKFKLISAKIESKVYDKQIDMFVKFQAMPTNQPLIIREGSVR